MGNLTLAGESKKDSLEVLIDLFVMATFPCALFGRVKNQSQWLMKPSICHIMSQLIMEGLFFSLSKWILRMIQGGRISAVSSVLISCHCLNIELNGHYNAARY